MQHFHATHDFFLDRRQASAAAKSRKAEVIDLGMMGRGSYGVYPPGDEAMMHLYAVERSVCRCGRSDEHVRITGRCC
jgi:hypothetical protein